MNIRPINNFPKYYITDDGKVFSEMRGTRKELKLKKYRHGYLGVCLRKNNKSYYPQTHRLVVEHFLSTWDPKLCVNHMDGNKKNNKVDNLEMVTQRENLIHAHKLGLNWSPCLKGEDAGQAKLTNQDAKYIRTQKGVQSYPKLAKQFNVGTSTICRCMNYQTFTEI